ncbi:LptF/LptG family permease [Qipengyuania sp.]|uniref:LptF/LptG family permease n=1 Tax=Qipengyuania sp. TaxID=2004515 RepID=UPI0035C8527E
MSRFFPAIDRYIARLVIMPTLAVFALATSLLVLDQLQRLLNFVAVQGGPPGVVIKMLAALMPEYTSLSIPLGLLLGILLAFRKLATSSELDVMRAVGWSYGRLLRVPYIITALLMAANLMIVFYVQPVARYWYEELDYDLKSGALGAAIRVGEFNTIADRVALKIDGSEDRGRELNGIFARISTEDGQTLSISARRGTFLASRDNPDTIILRLLDGTIVQDGSGSSPRVFTFARNDLPIDLPQVEEFRKRGGKEAEYILPELLRVGWNSSTPDAERDASQAAFNFRLVEVVMMALMPLLAVALAIPPKRSSSALGVFVSVVMVVSYHKVNEYAQDVASLGRVDPFLALWVPFLIFAALIAWMYWRVAHVPGGQAIGALESWFAKLSKQLGKLFGRRRRSRAMQAMPAE